MITTNSRYRDSKVEKVAAVDGSVRLAIVPSAPSDWQFNYTYVSWILGDRPDIVATRFYGDPSLWWNIADANPEILDWTDVRPGTVIRVPSA